MVKPSLSNAGGDASIPGQGAMIPHTSWPENQKVKQKQYCNKFNKDFKNGSHQKNLKKKKKKIKRRNSEHKWRNVLGIYMNEARQEVM